MAPNYKLSYFNVTGIAEPIRYLFAYGSIEFEDIRFEKDEWDKMKSSTPFERCPLLEMDGKIAHQSVAICRYLANKIGGLTGKDDWDALQVDVIIETIGDFRAKYTEYFLNDNEELKVKKREAILTEHNPFYLQRFDKIVSENEGYFVGGQLTWVDIYFSAISELLTNLIKEDILANYPNLKQLVNTVNTLPKIQKHRETRPKTVL